MNTVNPFSRAPKFYGALLALTLLTLGCVTLAFADPGQGNARGPNQERGAGAGGRGGPVARVAGGAQRGERGGGPGRAAEMQRGYVFDGRYNHNHYYPPRGLTVAHLDGGYRMIPYANGRYFYRGGVWYRPYGASFVVAAAPFGLIIPFLPDFYTTLWFGGVPYYYANDTYYAWRREAQGYVVTEPPPETANSAYRGTPPPPPDEFFVYPKAGQGDEQVARDRFECHRWATSQTGFDPTEPGGGVDESQNESKRADYRRAITACLEGRGYSVK